jgi:hypothetical protein
MLRFQDKSGFVVLSGALLSRNLPPQGEISEISSLEGAFQPFQNIALASNDAGSSDPTFSMRVMADLWLCRLRALRLGGNGLMKPLHKV